MKLGAASGWDDVDYRSARRFGDEWLTESHVATLFVPSVVAGTQWSELMNPAHPPLHELQSHRH
ncbi:RES domain-containing protein [Burkholderia sp. PU8-34]